MDDILFLVLLLCFIVFKAWVLIGILAAIYRMYAHIADKFNKTS